MNLLSVARLIPAEFRNDILEGNTIFKAIATPGDPHMFILFTIWTTFVNSAGNLDMSCTKCLADILQNFRALEPHLIELRKADQLLKD